MKRPKDMTTAELMALPVVDQGWVVNEDVEPDDLATFMDATGGVWGLTKRNGQWERFPLPIAPRHGPAR